jgi:hypothetical protein
MTFAELHMAVREVLHGTGLSTFLVSVQALENHPGRIDVQWSVWVSRELAVSTPAPTLTPVPSYFFKSHDPARVVNSLRKVIADKRAVPDNDAELVAIGEVPESTDGVSMR